MKILMRGDCTCRRAVFYNKDIFGSKSEVVQNQKAPFVLFNDHLNGIGLSADEAGEHVDVARMPAMLQTYFLGQFDRSIFSQESADILMIDSYADMNFELYQSKEKKAKLWIHRGYLKNESQFLDKFEHIGRRTLAQSIVDAVEFIKNVRLKYGEIPVIFLNQQVEYYPKLSPRLDYYELGRLVSQRVKNCKYGGVIQSNDLELADVGSCGPGLTLHYSGDTYRKMLQNCMNIFWGDNENKSNQTPDHSDLPEFEISIKANENPPYERSEIYSKFKNYFLMPDADVYEPKYTPAVIDLDKIENFESWAKAVKKKVGDNAFRSEKKALQRGYVVEQIDRKTYIPDIYEINTSMPVRSGGAMKSAYSRSIEEMGGYPTKLHEPKLPSDVKYWGLMFGALQPLAGYAQGNIIVNRKLIAYISVRRYGDLILYPQLLGHGEHLADGVMAQLHFHVLRWICSSENPYAAGAKLLMYTAVNMGNEGLRTWKKRAGFVPARIALSNY